MAKENSKLHKYLFMVTPFSKTLALSMFIVFPILSFYFGVWYQKSVTSYQTFQNQAITPSVTPMPMGCKTDSDCKAGERCLTTGPIIANQPLKKACVASGFAVPQ